MDAGIVTLVLMVGLALGYAALQALRGGAKALGDVKARRAAFEEEARFWVEQRALGLLGEFSSLEDEEIAQLIRDELVNRRETDPAYSNWATGATVGRIRRTVLVTYARKQKKNKHIRE